MSYGCFCGALDCESCHPGGAAHLAREEYIGERFSFLDDERKRLTALLESGREDLDKAALEAEISELEDDIDRIEQDYDESCDESCDEDDAREEDYWDARREDREWGGIDLPDSRY